MRWRSQIRFQPCMLLRFQEKLWRERTETALSEFALTGSSQRAYMSTSRCRHSVQRKIALLGEAAQICTLVVTLTKIISICPEEEIKEQSFKNSSKWENGYIDSRRDKMKRIYWETPPHNRPHDICNKFLVRELIFPQRLGWYPEKWFLGFRESTRIILPVTAVCILWIMWYMKMYLKILFFIIPPNAT